MNIDGIGSLEELKKILSCDEQTKELVDRIFEILSSKDMFDKFLDYDNNKDSFFISGNQVDRVIYLRKLGEIFGRKNKYGTITMDKFLYKEPLLSEIEEYKKRYSVIYDKYNMDRILVPMYEFRDYRGKKGPSDKILRKEDEPDWTINEKLYKYVFGEMPDDFTLEEKIMYIYCKLCSVLSYDDRYFFREQLEDDTFSSVFSKEELERIKLGSKITCWSFSRVFAKFINELKGDVEGVVVLEGGSTGHYLTGFYTDKISAMADAVNVVIGGTNDLMRAKNGIDFAGIHAISDRNGVLEMALNKVYPLVLSKDPVSLGIYLELLNQMPREKIPDDIEGKLKVFLKYLKDRQVFGSEAIQTFNIFRDTRFFGENLEVAFAGEKENLSNEDTGFKRITLIRSRKDESKIYLVDTQQLDLSIHSDQEIIDKLNTGELVYERRERRLEGISPNNEGR